MASLKNIKLKIQSVKKTSTVTRAMEAVSAVKMRKSQERALSGRTYAAVALSILERVAGANELKGNPLVEERKGKACFVVVTSDKGLAGSLNSAVVRKTEEELRARGLFKDEAVIIALGRRGADYFASRGWNVAARHENLSDSVEEADMRAITDLLLSLRERGEAGECFVAYQNFLSTFEQKPVIRKLLPLSREGIGAIVKGIQPAKGKYAGADPEAQRPRVATYLIEPDPASVLSVLLPRLLNIAVFHALLEAKASEHSARMVAMKNATDKAKELAATFTRTFNKVRQAAITREVSEITSGMEAMK